MTVSQNRRFSLSSLTLIGLALVAAVMVSNALFRGIRLDLTENNLYTLSAGTKSLLGKLDEPIDLYLYYSDRATKDIPSLRSYANRVRELLEEFAAAGDGKLRLSVIDPLPFSEDEDRAAQFGLQAVAVANSADPIYLGLAGTNAVGDEETIAFFQPDKENFLEYELARLVSTLSNPEKPVVGLISGAAMGPDFNPQSGQMSQGWAINEQVSQLYEVRDLGTDADSIAADVSVLWIVQPKNLADTTLYAIDQYVLGGGKTLIFVDPLADADAPPPNPQMPGMPQQGQSSNLGKLFDAWDLEFTTDNIVADSRLGLAINGPGGRPLRHIGLLGIDAGHLNPEDVVTADLGTINVGSAGYLQLKDDSEVQFEALISSSESAMSIPASRLAFLPDPAVLMDNFVPAGEPFVIAARLSGKFRTAFPDGAPEPATDTDSEAAPEDAGAEAETPAENAAEPIAVADAPVNLIVVADVDMLSDRMWTQSQNFFGRRITSAFADNGNFVVNAIENLTGSADLISVRSRDTFSRPFTKVEDLRAEADAAFRQTEQQLQSELAETETKLSELQTSRDDSGNLLLSPEQEAEIQRFVDERARIRKELRAVQRNLDADIEKLGTTLKAINIGLVPLLLTVFGLLALWRRQRKVAP